MDKFPLSLQMHSDFVDDKLKYFAVSGATEDGYVGVTILVNQQTVSGKKTVSLLAAVMVNTAVFGDLIKEAIGANPFKALPILSNIQVSAYVSSADFMLPDPVSLPAPFESTRSIKRGFCFDGRIGRPTTECGADVVCTLAQSAMTSDDGALTLQGCVDVEDVSLVFGVADVKLTKTVTLRNAGLEYTATSVPPSVSFGATATLDVVMEDVVTFNGKLYLAQSGPATLMGFSFSTSGMIPRAFGVQKLHMYNLVLAAEVGVVGLVPVVNSLTIGGGICFGKYDDCAALVSGNTDEELLALGHSTTPRFSDYHEHVAMLQARGKLTGTIAAKLYAGFSAGEEAFFYAGFTAVTMADIAAAFAGSSQLPDWMSSVRIEAYDQDACDEAGGERVRPCPSDFAAGSA